MNQISSVLYVIWEKIHSIISNVEYCIHKQTYKLKRKINILKLWNRLKTYKPLAYIVDNNIYADGGINPIIDLVYTTYNIKGYSIIDLSESKGISIILKTPYKPIIVSGVVLDIIDNINSVCIETTTHNKITHNIHTGMKRKYIRNIIPYRYILNKDLSIKKIKIYYTIGIIKGTMWIVAGLIINILSNIKTMGINTIDIDIDEYKLSLIDRMIFDENKGKLYITD